MLLNEVGRSCSTYHSHTSKIPEYTFKLDCYLLVLIYICPPQGCGKYNKGYSFSITAFQETKLNVACCSFAAQSKQQAWRKVSLLLSPEMLWLAHETFSVCFNQKLLPLCLSLILCVPLEFSSQRTAATKAHRINFKHLICELFPWVLILHVLTLHISINCLCNFFFFCQTRGWKTFQHLDK